ncbi:MAG: hypothetical protein PHI12_06660 [Dehalococcoidales bacterium]|nr:hypothetical protein [Dehalococcoidales bacterium]
MASVTDRIKKSVEALDKKQLKQALYLTTKRGLERHHGYVEEAARKCLANKDAPDSSACDLAIKTARDKLQATITVPMETTDMEGLEDYLKPSKEVENMPENMPVQAEKTDEELYAECAECHVADAVVKFVNISQHDCNGETGKAIQPLLQDETTPPEKWLKTMREVAGKDGCGQEAYKEVLGDLEDYLKEQDSEILKKANKEV